MAQLIQLLFLTLILFSLVSIGETGKVGKTIIRKGAAMAVASAGGGPIGYSECCRIWMAISLKL